MIEYRYTPNDEPDPQKKPRTSPITHKLLDRYYAMAQELLSRDDAGFIKGWEEFTRDTIIHASDDRVIKSLTFAFMTITLAREKIIELERRLDENA